MAKIIDALKSESARKLCSFIIVLCWLFYLIGGTGYLFYLHLPQFAVAGLGVCAMAWPVVARAGRKLLQ